MFVNCFNKLVFPPKYTQSPTSREGVPDWILASPKLRACPRANQRNVVSAYQNTPNPPPHKRVYPIGF